MDLAALPQKFIDFLAANDIDPRIYTITDLPRFIRFDENEISASEVEHQLQAHIEKVEGVDGFWRLDGRVKIVGCQAYKDGKIFGMDISSAIAVYALEPTPDSHILDICCAPGAKLCMLASLVGTSGEGTITGVDISAHRAATCRSLLKKHRSSRARIFVADGTTFDVHAPALKSGVSRKQREREESKEALVKPFYAPKLIRNDPQLKGRLYDRVLVDAECTHDGSLVHIWKYTSCREGWDFDAFERQVLDPLRIDSIQQLQKNLLANGWRLLKPGGILVYSTCSLSKVQNECVIAWFLSNHRESARLEPVHCGSIVPSPPKLTPEFPDIDLSAVRRFDPLISNTSGFFVARIRKLAADPAL
ncbi:uncharacterized protein VTP21DRAFT_9522 [Calcarisporiella thermophila]|uniref:uncharacterized protein n=1 Tax=Calcarisporiella thermophila TaxID=911321 RepID=UPI003744624F